MADRFWVGGGSSTNWNATANTNWSATSGGANNASVPGSSDRAIFDANSGVGTSVNNVNSTIQAMNAGAFLGTITHSASVVTTINTAGADALVLPSSGTYTPVNNVSGFTFTHTSGNADITCNGKRLGQIIINGAGGTTRCLDAFRCDVFSSSAIGITTGTFDGNGQSVTINAINSSNSNTRGLILGGGTWTIGGGAAATQTIWNMATITNLTFTKGASNIVVPSNGLGSYRLWSSNTLVFNDLTIASNSGRGMFFIGNAGGTFNALNLGSGNTLALPAGTTTVNTAPTWTGTPSLPILICGGTPGNQSTLSIPSGTLSLAWGTVRDIIGSGGASFVATNSFDSGNNTGWAISAPSIAPTAAEIASLVWDELLAGHAIAGSAGLILGTIPTTLGTPAGPSISSDISDVLVEIGGLSSDINNLPAQTAAFVWEEQLPPHNAPNSAGNSLNEVHMLQGLQVGNPMTVTPTSRAAGTIAQTLSGDGTTTKTVTRNP